jgi:hypothetical protein
MTDFNAAAVTHVLSTAGEIIIASKRIRLSWFNAGWMLAALLPAREHFRSSPARGGLSG